MIKKRTCNNCRWYPICIDPCDNCEIYNSIKFDKEGEIVEETLCPHEQHDKKCNKIAAITCEEFEYPLGGYDPELEKIMKSLE
ncbi:MAG: hypothetical protein PHE92_09250 [Candidatus Cloacimonetes bacterium]|nr:hypothetical protein [Candidatus Cloacimonadota bacterium]